MSRAGFLFEPTLRGYWIRLPFDMGRDWENQHATWAAQMLAAAHYPVHLATDPYHPATEPAVGTGPAHPSPNTAPAWPGRRPHH
ncbi:hypothetical protein [Streptomyces meridianus]|uniref:Uncharacterized protein n=1 Tax=Streptomyces meridianus TaxID=2938945 RepID=A0ABT0XBP3_9ACTN|nr:hypothetical protein [Streptomyces meridianus]MCM2579690.1 hypothetical protein [Streptomyces meridianus]